jgi:hypothetical protein
MIIENYAYEAAFEEAPRVHEHIEGREIDWKLVRQSADEQPYFGD